MANLPAPPMSLIRALLGRRGSGAAMNPVRGSSPVSTMQQPPQAVRNPQLPPTGPPGAPGINPYTGEPLGPNEYVGVAGSEAENPGKTRIPPPGWWDPSNPNYERRAYYRDAKGNAVGIEAGYQGDAEHPFDTGREGERNAEYGRSGEGIVRMSQPGMPTWGPGQERQTPGTFPGPGGQSGPGANGPQNPRGMDLARALMGAGQQPQQPQGDIGLAGGDPQDALMKALAGLLGRVPQQPGNRANVPR